MENNGKFYGFVVYEIVENGLLNGLFVNNALQNKGKTMNEIARRKDEDSVGKSDVDISGEYNNAWIGIEEGIVQGTLKISPSSNFTYELEWEGKNVSIKGTGMRIGSNQFVAIYWKTDDPICFEGSK
ncbi:MAG: hypothetical protein HY958_11770 [Bacteroidia bacterium]|nr:hypothetical protein [Bacteroidia bacterium]